MAAMAGDVEDFDLEIDLPRFLNPVLEKAEYICQRILERRIVEQHIVVVDQTVSLLFHAETPDRLLTLLTKKC